MRIEVQIEKVYKLYGKLGELNSKMGFRAKHGLMILSDLRLHLVYRMTICSKTYLEIEREKS